MNVSNTLNIPGQLSNFFRSNKAKAVVGVALAGIVAYKIFKAWADAPGNSQNEVSADPLTQSQNEPSLSNRYLARLEFSYQNFTEIDLQDYPSLKSLVLDYNHNLARVDLSHNPQLQYLKLGGNQLTELDLTHNRRLTHLKVDHNQLTELDLSQNQDLETIDLSHNSFVAGPDLSRNTKLKYVDLGGNQLTTIPPHYAALPRTCQINLEGNRLSPEAIAEFKALVEAQKRRSLDLGPTVTYSIDDRWAQNARQDDEGALEDVLQSWIDERHSMEFISLQPFLGMDNESKETLRDFLTRVRDTKDYRSAGQSRENLVRRLHAMISLASANPAFKESMIALMADGLATCGDRIILNFGQIDMLAKWHIVLHESNPQTIADLAIRIQRYDALVKHGLRQAERMELRDEIETVLYYLISLKDQLSLPIDTDGMLYPGMSGVNSEMLGVAAQEISGLSDLDLLSQSDYWRRYLEKQEQPYQQAVGGLNDRYEEILGKVMEDGSLKERQKTQMVDRIRQERESAIGELTKQYTLLTLPELAGPTIPKEIRASEQKSRMS